MPNVPQSSRVAGSLTRSLFPEVLTSGVIPTPSYTVEKSFTQTGETDIQIKKKEKATLMTYAVGAIVVVGLVYYASTKLD